ncbi:hypothetical protein F3Y22_tig00116997pilonHSYRG00655 [Hibiscus syriacus]|uniref:DOG1 domain-containing protein n=1 Tax=Hibiscus syriacus TaxID=106335 RepID=A0A6A2WRE6_HIBSY|nr:hypothetical protein F3Y22_tig00116997pilonHSYRG00655 [Hibiscus syriacus]
MPWHPILLGFYENILGKPCRGAGAASTSAKSSRAQWIVDSWATHHVTPDATHITHPTDLDGPCNLEVGNGSSLNVHSVGRLLGIITSSLNSMLILVVFEMKLHAIFFFEEGRMGDFTHLPWIAIQSDWGGEYRNWTAELARAEILHRVTCPHSSEQNRVVEPYLINRLPSKVLNNVSPFEKLFNKKPDHTTMRVFGCRCFRHLRDFQPHKLMPRSQECTFLGYNSQHRAAKQDDVHRMVSSSRSTSLEVVPRRHRLCPTTVAPILEHPSTSTSQTSSSENEVAHGNEFNNEIESSYHSTQNLHPSSSPMISAEEVNESSQPPVEVADGSDQVPLPNTHPMVTRSKHRIFKPKFMMNLLLYNEMEHERWFHCQLDEQQLDARQDFKETFSPVVKFPTLNVILSIVVSNKWPLRHVDVNNAFLHGDLSEEVFMQQPLGFEQLAEDGTMHVCKLHKALYGLRQAPRNWNNKLKDSLIQLGFLVSRADASMFVSLTEGEITYILVYVDDTVITGQLVTTIKRVVQSLKINFSLKDLGELNYFLGIEVQRSPQGLMLSQKKFISELLEKSNMMKATSTSTPMVVSNKLQKDVGKLIEDAREFRSMVGALLYACHTRPDIVYSVSKVAQFMHEPSETHMQVAKRILRYLAGTVEYGLLFKPSREALRIVAFAEVDWGGCVDDRRSMSRHCVLLGGNMVSWSTKKQKVVSRSTMEAEYRSLADAVAEVTWIDALLNDIGVTQQEKPIIWLDNTSVISHMSVNQLPIERRLKQHSVPCKCLSPRSSHGEEKQQNPVNYRNCKDENQEYYEDEEKASSLPEFKFAHFLRRWISHTRLCGASRRMLEVRSHSPRKYYEENDGGEHEEIGKKLKEKESGSMIDEIVENFRCMNIAKRETYKRENKTSMSKLLVSVASKLPWWPLSRANHQCSSIWATAYVSAFGGLTNLSASDFLIISTSRMHSLLPSREVKPGSQIMTFQVIINLREAQHSLWRQEQKSRAAKIERQLKARRELEALIKEQLNRFHAHYNQALVPTHLEDVSKLLMPQWAAPQELATLFWLGDWRPSAILELLQALAPLSFLSDSTSIQPALNSGNSSASSGIQSMFKKISRVITKAQKLRFKALELAVKKLLNQTEAAEFLVALSGIQVAIHQFDEHKRLQKGPVTVSIKPQNTVETSKQPKTNIEDRISHFLKTSDSSEHGQGIQHALCDCEFEEQRGLRKGPVTRSIRFQDVSETSNQPNIPFEQDRSEERIVDAISEFEDQQGLRMEPVGLPLESWDVAGTSKQAMIRLKDRVSSWEKFSRMVEQERSGQRIEEQL